MSYFKKLCLFVGLVIFFSISALFAKSVYVIEFNDFHGMIYPTMMDNKKVPGAVYFANAILKEKEKDGLKNSIVVSGGDNYTGTIVSYDTKGEAINDVFKAMGVELSAVGNHEFDWGQGHFQKWQEEGGFKFIAANVINNETKVVPTWDAPYKIININGVKIAFIGLSTIETRSDSSAKNLKGLKIEDPWKAAKYWINYLKEGKDKDGKPDVIIALTHIPSEQSRSGKIEGKELNELIEKTSDLDAILSAHSHMDVCGYVDNIPVMQSKCYGEKYGVLKIDIDDKTNKLLKITPTVYDVPCSGDILAENKIGKILAKYDYIREKYSKVLGSTTGLSYDPFKLSPLGVFIAKCMAKITNTQIGMMNAFGIRSNIEKGNITLGDVYRISPFNNSLVTMCVSGAELKRIFEYGLSGKVGCAQFYGVNIKCDSTRSHHKRILEMTLLDGTPINMHKEYSLCVNDFMATGGDGFSFHGATDIINHKDLILQDILIKEIENLKIVNTPSTDALKVVHE